MTSKEDLLKFCKLYFLGRIILVSCCIDDITNDEGEPLKSFVQLVDDNVKHVENVPCDGLSIDDFPGASSGCLFARAADDILIR